MKRIGSFVIFIVMTSLVMSQTVSPELISSSGDNFKNSSYQLDWSIGECVTLMHSAGDYVITQGFHQNSYVVSSVEDLRTDIKMFVYPNPTNDLVTIDFPTFEKFENVKINVMDLRGKVLQSAKFLADDEQLDFSSYAAGTYFISIIENNQLIKSFKIIKK